MSSPAALVTGASSGLGRAISLALAADGRCIVLLARDRGRLEQVGREVADAGGEAVVAAADVTDGPALTRVLRSTLASRRLDLVVHAAGVLSLRGVAELTDGDFERCFRVNVLGTSHVVQACLPLLEITRGRVVLVSSVAGLFPLPGGFGAYGASKWAVRGYGETVRAELAARGVGLTMAYPSILDTPMVRELGPEAPAVYRAFPWHDPDRAARALLRDAARSRRESYVTLGDRLAAWTAGAAPRLFRAGLHAVVSWRGGTTAP